MPQYSYKAKTASGETVEGVMQGETEASVLRTLQQRDLFPVHVLEADESGEVQYGEHGATKLKVKRREVGVYYSQLADLLVAGVPLMRSLETLISVQKPGPMKQVQSGVRDHVAKGEGLSASLRQFPTVFSELDAAMVAAGEEAGFLEDVLNDLADFIDRQDDLRSKVSGMMVYPVILMSLGVVILIVMLAFVVPKFQGFLSSMELPLPTKVLFALSDLMTKHSSLMVALLILFGAGVWALFKSDAGKDYWERLRFKLPLVGKVNRSVAIARFCRILGTMLHNGVPILRALTIGKDATGSVVMSEEIEEAAESVRAGEPLAEPFRRNGTFPGDVVEMIAIAEESNQMDNVLLQIADTVEKRTGRLVDAVVRLIEPLILVGLAVTIGFVAMGLLYPIFMMIESLSS